ncbi:biofilm regulation protein kinase SiaB [Synechococcus sp. CS-1328]|nr:biofilm regulation protein kinase SiaB [Synechococcus sp. CS-1328]
MTIQNLSALRQYFSAESIFICFNGPVSRSLISEIGLALKNHIESIEASQTAAIDVFSVYVEMSQNIRHYTNSQGYNEADSTATVVIAASDELHYSVSAGNVVEQADGEKLLERIMELAALDKMELKALYKSQLRQPRNQEAVTGAGLGLIQIARIASRPLEANLDLLDDGRAFFSLRAII